MNEALGLSPILHKLDMQVHTFNSSSCWSQENQRFKVILSYIIISTLVGQHELMLEKRKGRKEGKKEKKGR